MYTSVVEVAQDVEDVPAPVVIVPGMQILGTTEPEMQ
jgi:hypothetical protein